MSERFLKIITTHKNNTCFVTFILLEFLSCSLDVYFHQCVSAKIASNQVRCFLDSRRRRTAKVRFEWPAGMRRLPRESRSFQETPLNTFHDGLCMPVPYLHLNPEHSTSTVLLHNLDIFALHSRCKHWTHFHHALIHWTCTHCKHIKPPHTSALSEPCKWLSFILSILDREAFHLPSVQCRICWSSNQAGRVVPCCMNVELEPLIRWSNVTFFLVTAKRFRLSKDDGKSTFSEVPWPGHPENLKVRPREETKRRNDPFHIRITRVAPSCVFHGNFNLQLIWAEWRKPLRRHIYPG